MSLEPSFQLKQTNVSQPRLSHSSSQQSIAASQAASEGYYSLSENNGSESDEASRALFQTPPSQHRSATPSHEHLLQNSEAPTTSLKGVGIQRQPQQQSHRANPTTDRSQSPAVSTIAEERPETQGGRSSQSRGPMDSDSLATTPGQDTTPYIRFAIDQLTRDEEVRGSRLYPQIHAREEEDEDYPVERIVSDDGLGYMAQEHEAQRRISQHMPQQPQKHTRSRSPDQQLPKPMSVALPRAMQVAPPAGVPATNLPYNTNTFYRPETTASEPPRDLFVPFKPSDNSLPHAPLHFLPGILRPLSLGLLIILSLLMLGALIFSAVYSNRNGGTGLWEYQSFGDSRYFLFEYLPTIFGMIVFLWVIQVQVALQRIVPFISMASDSYLQRSEAVFLQLYPLQFLVPNLEHFRAGQPLIGGCYLVFWLFGWTIPLLASCFNVRYDIGSRTWIWVAVQGVIWATAALYILLILTLVFLIVFLRKQTGLKWDPRSLADIIALLERSNIMNDYDGSETFAKDDWDQLRNRSDRIGYWSTTKRPNDVFYGIGEEGGPARRYSIEQGRIREKGPERTYPKVAPRAQRQGDFSIRMDLRDQRTRLRYLPWYLRDTSVIAWIVIATVLLVAFLVVSFVNSSVRLGFLPQVFARTDASGFSASNFLYSFIPALIGHFLFLALLALDHSLRALRPYIALSSMGGATAEASLLVDYACRLPVSVTIAALENKHYQVAVLSAVSFVSVCIPILAGGCFWTQFYPGDDVVRVAADLPGYYALCFFLALYALSLLALLPGRRRAALPHRSNTLAEIISWVYQSPILADRAFARPQTKPELVTRLMGSAYLERSWGRSLTNLVRPSHDNLRESSPMNEKRGKHREQVSELSKRDSVLDPGKIKYGFGIHVGRDGLEHLGIDRVRRGGERSGRELVIWEEQQKRKSWSGSMV